MYFQTLRVHKNYFLGHVCLEIFEIFILKKAIRPQTLNLEKKLRMAVKKSKSFHTCVTVPRYMYEKCQVLNN